MPLNQIDFAAIIEQDRAERQKLEWQGTFLQYLELVKQRPTLADPRVKRVFGDETVKIYNFFVDKFFGMERTLEKIVRYFHSAAMGGEDARQVLYLGPVGSGKSSLVERLKRGLEDLNPIHVIEGCPIYEQPLHLIPRHLRKAFEDMLGTKVEGDPRVLEKGCPKKLTVHELREDAEREGVFGLSTRFIMKASGDCISLAVRTPDKSLPVTINGWVVTWPRPPPRRSDGDLSRDI